MSNTTNIVLVGPGNIGAKIVRKENGKYEWFVSVQQGDKVEFLNPPRNEEFPTEERARSSMNYFLETLGIVIVPDPAVKPRSALN